MATKQSRVTRRLFLKGAAAVAAAPYIIPASARGAAGRPAPSQRICMGFVGVGGQGSGDMGGFMGFPEVQAVAVCNVDSRSRLGAKRRAEERYAQQRASGTFKGCDDYADFRDLCAGRISTPSSVPRPTIGTPWSLARRCATARTSTARNRKRSPSAKGGS